jgi:hypothetical protein
MSSQSFKSYVVFFIALFLFGIFSLGSSNLRKSERTEGSGQILSS